MNPDAKTISRDLGHVTLAMWLTRYTAVVTCRYHVTRVI